LLIKTFNIIQVNTTESLPEAVTVNLRAEEVSSFELFVALATTALFSAIA